MILTFNPGVGALGLDIFISNGGTLLAGSLTVTSYNASTVLDTKTVSEPASTYFFGLSSTTAVTSVMLTYNQTESDGNPFVNNIAFGLAPASVPEPSTGTFCAAAAVLLVAAVRRRIS